MDVKKFTPLFIIASVVIISAVDMYVFSVGGTEATISWTVYVWGKKHPMVPLFVGILVGHFFWQMKKLKNCPHCGESLEPGASE